MTAKEYLRKYAAERKDADAIESEVRELRRRKERLQAVRDDGMPSTRGEVDQSNVLVKIEDLTSRLIRKTCEYIAEWISIDERIDRMENPEERAVLRYKYLTGDKVTWDMIADKMARSKRSAQLIHGSALRNFPMDGL